MMNGGRRKTVDVWIDCDPGHDDVVALMVAACADHCNILGLSTVHGNTVVENATQNALSVMELLKKDVDVHSGASKPLMRPSKLATHIHGVNGLAGIALLPDQPRKRASPDAVVAMYQAISQNPIPVTLVATGPLTNIALMLATYPTVSENIERLVFMGGSTGIGNITSQAEFNMFADPEAAKLVLETTSLSGKLYMVPLDVTHSVLMDSAIMEKLRQHGSPISNTLVELMTVFQATYETVYGFKNGVPVHDACAMVYALWPEIMSSRIMYVTVSIDQLTLGRTVCDVWSQQTQMLPNVHVVLSADVVAFWNLFMQVVEKLNTL
ncbi:uridine ribohydrolase [Schizosaccharomyces cryophilus OY26]|uniref:Uridine ribohydrolase n=1 Tax=Schizosaccharomyces cryophilus (strain OY26 / ATCC MYA-4695 / CBS 11777 / NBRC 106824 / NRRL Y48691) TaxID=653667 RepID=S9W0D0_SCHCR|nr:uridine ribohydrolase [Schizosaccharomyces cryophilus OY26]EPY51839.1 uridine ribohydrolase [Schizosaccharomyces cryophilus OY26]